MNKLDTFLLKAKKVHGDRYDYSKVEYKTCKDKVCIICPEHGEFWQTPDNHLNAKQGCPICGIKKIWLKRGKKTTKSFINEAKKVHGDKYDYSKVEYINNIDKVCIICPEHGEFWQSPSNHLQGQGCPKCKAKKNSIAFSISLQTFVDRAKKVHGNKYDYSKVKYISMHNKVCIICPEHGEFWQEPNSHLRGAGCPKCAGKGLSNSEVISRFKKVHGDKYDYSKTEYVNAKTKVCIICPEHGEFWQTPDKHLHGHGCQICSESKLEKEAKEILNLQNIKYEFRKHFDWLGKQHLDFYLPDYNVAIECQGEQHFYPVDFANKGEKWAAKQFEYNKKRDIKKHNACKNNIKHIYYFSNLKRKKFLNEKLYNDFNELIEEIIH